MSAPSAEVKNVAQARAKTARWSESGRLVAEATSPCRPVLGPANQKPKFYPIWGSRREQRRANFSAFLASQVVADFEDTIGRFVDLGERRVTPKLNRSALEITPGSQPIARCTGDGSLEPLAQAEPVEQAMPA